MKVTFLGTGTSHGVPVIACDCEVCMSTDPRDKRLRSSLLITEESASIVIDVGPDFRQQMLRAGLRHLDAVLLTHEHNDHVVGMDDIRPFNFRQGTDMPVYGLERVLNEIKSKFFYIFESNPYPGAPRVVCHALEAGRSLQVTDRFSVLPVEVMHGALPILGFRTGNFAYITDASFISERSADMLKGLDVLVLNALQYRKHYSHYTYDEAVKAAAEIGAKTTYFTHMSHQMGTHAAMEATWPAHIRPSYDGLEILL